MQTSAELKRFVVDNFLYGRDGSLKDDDSFLEAGIIDSTGVLELIAFLESRFEIKVADRDLTPENLDSITKLTRYVEGKVLGARGGM